MAWNLEEAVSYYQNQGAPREQGALVGLLKEIQAESGGSVPPYALGVIAETYGIKESLLLALIKRIPSLRLGDTHYLELCAGPSCGKSTALAAAAETLCRNASGKVTLKYTPCMRMCGKGPNIRWDGRLHSGATEALLRQLMEEGDS